MCQCARAAQAEQAEREWEDFEQEKAKRQWQAEEAASTPASVLALALAPPPAAVDMTPEAAEQAGELEAAKAAKAAKVAEGTEAATVLRATKQDPAEGGDEGGDGGEVEVGRAGAEGARAAQVGGGVSQVLVKTTWGIITVENVVSVTSVKEALRRKLGMPGLDGYLVHNGWRLAEERAPRECGIESSSTIHLYPRLLGGAAGGDGSSSSGQARTSGQARAAELEEEAVEAVGCKRTRPDEGDGDDGWDNGSTAPPPAPPPSPAPAASVAAERASIDLLGRAPGFLARRPAHGARALDALVRDRLLPTSRSPRAEGPTPKVDGGIRNDEQVAEAEARELRKAEEVAAAAELDAMGEGETAMDEGGGEGDGDHCDMQEGLTLQQLLALLPQQLQTEAYARSCALYEEAARRFYQVQAENAAETLKLVPPPPESAWRAYQEPFNAFRGTTAPEITPDQRQARLELLAKIAASGNCIAAEQLGHIMTAPGAIVCGYPVDAGAKDGYIWPLAKPGREEGTSANVAIAESQRAAVVLQQLLPGWILGDVEHRARHWKEGAAPKGDLTEVAELYMRGFPKLLVLGGSKEEGGRGAFRDCALKAGAQQVQGLWINPEYALKTRGTSIIFDMHPQNMLALKAGAIDMAERLDVFTALERAAARAPPAPASLAGHVRREEASLSEKQRGCHEAPVQQRANEIINGRIIPFGKNIPVVQDKVKSAGIATQEDVDAYEFKTKRARLNAQTTGNSAAAVACSIDGKAGGKIGGKIGGKGKGVHELEKKIKELTAARDKCTCPEKAQRIEEDIKEVEAELLEAQEKKSEIMRKAGKAGNHAAKGWSGGSGRKVLPCDARKERAACEKWCEDHPEYWSDEAKGVPAQCNKCEAKSALYTFAVRDQEEVRLIRRKCGTCAYARRSGELWPVARVPKGAMMSYGNVGRRKAWKKAGS